MAKSLLSLGLMMTQLLSWSVSPLYLCVAGDGSVCIDFGPENCHCCMHSQDVECAGECACTDHDRSQHEQQAGHEEKSVAAEPCDCTHIQISQTPNSTLIPSTNSPDAERLVVFLATITCDLCAHAGVPPTDARNGILQTLHAPPSALAVLASVIMRC